MSALETLALDAARYRADFPILSQTARSGRPLAYLDNAASTQHPTAVIDAMSECYARFYANVHRGIHTLSEASTAAYEQARETVATFVNAASAREVIFAAGTTAAINLVARSWGDVNVGPDDVVLLTMMEHHANIVPWHQLAQRTGCRVVFAPLTDDGQVDTRVVDQLLQEHHPKLFAFTAVSNVLGTITPVTQWTQLAHQVGARVLVDAAQAAPQQEIDVQAWNTDWMVFSGHKICGPTGIGVLHGKEAVLEAMPPFLGGGGMIHRVTTSGFEPAGLPEKFEAGTPPITEAIGLAAAVRYLCAVGMQRIHTYEKQLMQRVQTGLAAIEGVRLLGPAPQHKAGIVSMVIDGVHAHDVAQWLDTRGIAVRAGHHCTMPLHHSLGISASTRASFYFYNTLDEVDALVDAVREVREKFAPSGRRRRRRASES